MVASSLEGFLFFNLLPITANIMYYQTVSMQYNFEAFLGDLKTLDSFPRGAVLNCHLCPNAIGFWYFTVPVTSLSRLISESAGKPDLRTAKAKQTVTNMPGLPAGHRQALQCERSASVRRAQLQAAHLLRPLRLSFVRPDQTGPSVQR